MTPKSEQLQIRVRASQKKALKRYARSAGVDVSTYVLLKALPPVREEVRRTLDALRRREGRDRYALAELNDLIAGLTRTAFAEAVSDVDIGGLSPFLQNYVAAMVELTASRRGLPPPVWVRDVEPLEEPYFEGDLVGLRPYLLRVAPVAFRRRNIFVDSTIGDRV